MKEQTLITLAILVALATAASGYIILQRNQGAAQKESQQPDLSRVNADRCLPLQEVQLEIPCEEALKQAFLAFPGDIYNVSFETISYRATRNAEPVSVSSWLVYLYQDEQIELSTGKVNSIAVAVHPLAPKPYIYAYFEETP